jgi:hypothetical protein
LREQLRTMERQRQDLERLAGEAQATLDAQRQELERIRQLVTEPPPSGNGAAAPGSEGPP